MTDDKRHLPPTIRMSMPAPRADHERPRTWRWNYQPKSWDEYHLIMARREASNWRMIAALLTVALVLVYIL